MANQNEERAFLFDDPEAMTEALTRGVQEALKQHKQAQNYVAAWRDGKVVKIAPDAIPTLAEGTARATETTED